jgi:predicted CoA-binding protein
MRVLMVIMDNTIARALASRTIAIVGLSKDPSKPSSDVALYLLSRGYKIVPVNPTANEILGEKCYRSLVDLPDEIKRVLDVVDIFRRPDDVPQIVEEAIELRSKYHRPSVIWMQLGIVNEIAAKRARDAGLSVVMDRCMKIEHIRSKT